jgi:hypothetical protein
MMDNNSTNINKTNNYLSPQITELKKEPKAYVVRNQGPILGQNKHVSLRINSSLNLNIFVCIDIQSCLWIRRGRDRMVVGFTITYAKQNVSVYQH